MSEPEKTIVTVNEARPIGIQLGHAQFGRDERINLIPGVNLVDAKLWEEAKKLATVKAWLKTPTQNEERAVIGRMMVEESKGLPALDAKSADALLRDVFDEKLLAQWIEDEKRQDVRTLIKARQNEIVRIRTQAFEEQKLKDAGEKPKRA